MAVISTSGKLTQCWLGPVSSCPMYVVRGPLRLCCGKERKTDKTTGYMEQRGLGKRKDLYMEEQIPVGQSLGW